MAYPPGPATLPTMPAPTLTASAYYPNCAAAEAAGAAPLSRGRPGYRPELDRDGDGVACDQDGQPSSSPTEGAGLADVAGAHRQPDRAADRDRQPDAVADRGADDRAAATRRRLTPAQPLGG